MDNTIKFVTELCLQHNISEMKEKTKTYEGEWKVVNIPIGNGNAQLTMDNETFKELIKEVKKISLI